MRKIAMSKAETRLLEPFQGLPLESIHLPVGEGDLGEARQAIIAAGVAGFDTESKPTFNAGEASDGPHVVQFALRDRAFIFQTHREEARALVSELLQTESVLKVGFGLKNDRSQINTKLGVPVLGILDLNQVFRKRGYVGQIGVRAAVGEVLHRGFPKSKKVSTSNWAAPQLTARQLLYAANDAYAALLVMDALEPGEVAAAVRRDRKTGT